MTGFASLRELLQAARPSRQVVIIGTNPLLPELERLGEYFRKTLGSDPELRLEVFYESDNENFAQAIVMEAARTRQPDHERLLSYSELAIHRTRIAGSQSNNGLRDGITEHLPANIDVSPRVRIRQLHLRIPANIIIVDDRLWYCLTTISIPTVADYVEVTEGDPMFASLKAFAEFVLEPGAVDVYTSVPGDELIWVYDQQKIPRGIFPRGAFYTTEYARYSVWGFVVSRQGKILLQKRSATTKDNRGLWDKSVGGHVDLTDASTALTAKRELVEEMYLPKAEFTKYVRADVQDVIDFGEWNPRKRPERYFRDSFDSLGEDDWALFRATDEQTQLPLTVQRVSERLWHERDDKPPTIRRTVFISDVYFFIAPESAFDDKGAVSASVVESEEGASSDHRLVTVDELRTWIRDVEAQGDAKSTFTDDILYMMLDHREILESITAFAKYVFANPEK